MSEPITTKGQLDAAIEAVIREFEASAPHMVIGIMIRRSDGALSVESLTLPTEQRGRKRVFRESALSFEAQSK